MRHIRFSDLFIFSLIVSSILLSVSAPSAQTTDSFVVDSDTSGGHVRIKIGEDGISIEGDTRRGSGEWIDDLSLDLGGRLHVQRGHRRFATRAGHAGGAVPSVDRGGRDPGGVLAGWHGAHRGPAVTPPRGSADLRAIRRIL